MKRIYLIILIASLAANAGLMMAIRGRHSADGTATALPSATGTKPAETSAAPNDKSPLAAAMAATAAASASPHSPKPMTWSDLYSTDMRQLAANLRAAGLSERMVFTIVAALTRQQTMAKAREIMADTASQPFWKTGSDTLFDREKWKLVMEAQKQERELMTSLFGTEAINENDREQLQQRFGPLPLEKLQQLQALNQDYMEQSMALNSFGMGPTMPWDREARVKLEEQKRKDIAALLTPEELQTYDLYSSSTANTMRRQLASFAPTQEEFLAIYQLRKPFDDKYNYNTMADPSSSGMERMNAQKDLNNQIKGVLGDARYADYQRSTDFGFQTAASVVQRLNLPPENANAVYALQQDMQKRLADARTLAPDARTAAMKDIAVEANTKLTTLLTPQGLDAYKNRGGTWLRMAERPPMTRPVAPKG